MEILLFGLACALSGGVLGGELVRLFWPRIVEVPAPEPVTDTQTFVLEADLTQAGTGSAAGVLEPRPHAAPRNNPGVAGYQVAKERELRRRQRRG